MPLFTFCDKQILKGRKYCEMMQKEAIYKLFKKNRGFILKRCPLAVKNKNTVIFYLQILLYCCSKISSP